MPDESLHRLTEEFGGNEWLVDELYEQYRQNKNSVDQKWWPLFASLDADASASGKHAAGDSGNSPRPVTQPLPVVKQAAPAATATPSAAPVQQPPAQPAAATQATAVPAQKAAPASATPAAPTSKPSTAKTNTTPIPAQLPPTAKNTSAPEEDSVSILRGPAKAIAANMVSSLEVPTATSVRAIPAKLLIDNRLVINSNLARARGGKVSFTHLIGYAVIRALKQFPSMNVHYAEQDGKPVAVQPAHINFGIAIDMPKPDGTRSLVVPNIKKSETLSFSEFWRTYEDLIKRARAGKLTADDYAGTTASLTNPGGIGTVHSVPRLSKGQASIIGVGALDYPAEFQGTSERIIAKNAISKVVTLTSTYDHRVIQGAGSGEFLKLVHQLLLGADDFYDEIFESLRIPYEPVRWSPDVQVDPFDQINKVARIQQLIHAYRVRGHLMADTDPLEYVQRKHPDLDVLNHGLTLWDLDREWPTGGFGGKQSLKFRDILGVLRDAYCRTTGVEYMHLQDPEQRKWFQDELEHPYSKPSREEQLRIVSKLNSAEAFETFLQTKYVGQKRFSLEGGESLIPLLDSVLADAADDGLDEVAIGMAHRGRLNVLTNIAGKTYGQVFREFEGNDDPRSVQGSGDVKYHLGTEGTFTSINGNQTKVYLAANPSHLEAADPVLEGIVRAKQDVLDTNGASFDVLPLLIHGDAAFAGQGVVAETLNLSQLRGYRTGGTIHVVVNNQVGFTTSPSSSRSSVYSTDVAKMIQAPIFHVNGDDPEAVVRVAQLAFKYRQKFAADIVIDLVCYRRRGHNEGDDPSMTQPLMYNLIEAKRSVRRLYTEALIGRGDITGEEAEQLLRDYQERLERAFAETHAAQTSPIPIVTEDKKAVADLERPVAQRGQEDSTRAVPTVSAQMIGHIGGVQTTPPEGFTLHPKIEPLLRKREVMSREGNIDWGFGELLALGSLAMEGVPIRFTGQDTQRGTFAQRHSVLHDRKNGEEWAPYQELSESQARFMVYNSSLSEYAALGFEYGYSVERTDAMVLWEAQYGDFANGAQSMIDVFISSAEQKWGQHSSLVMLLPHGYEGQGPEHTSAHIERYLQMCAEDNMVLAQPTTPASHFHLLRRQAYSRPRKPLIVFTPKQLLRLKAAASSLEDFTSGEFQPVIGDSTASSSADRVVLVSGRLYYDLLAARTKSGDTSTALVRVEQLYPFPVEEIAAELAKYPNAEVVWAQDEPANQGPWPIMGLILPAALGKAIRPISRPASASTATGSSKRHAVEQEALISKVFAR